MKNSSIASTDAIFAAAPVALPRSYRMSAKGARGEIYLYGDVGDEWFGGVTAKQFADDLKALGAVSDIDLRINSYGGNVFDGLSIYRLLVEHKARIVVHVDGVAASIASIIAMAGDEIRIAEAGQMMIHNAWGIGIGEASDLRRMADLLDTTTASLRDVYVARTGMDADEVSRLMDAETWFPASEAVEKGFATTVAENLRIAAKFDPSKHRFRNAPTAVVGTPNADAMRDRIARMKVKMQRQRRAV